MRFSTSFQSERKIGNIVKAKGSYYFGLRAEKVNQLDIAEENYKKALSLLPELTECKIRLAILAVKNNNTAQAFFHLKGIKGEKGAYIRGFAYMLNKNWQEANREWKSIRNQKIDNQRQIIKQLLQRDRLILIRQIEQSIEDEFYLVAKLDSLKFIENFGSDPIVEQNLENHIQPFLDRQIWKSSNWQKIVVKTEEIWLEQQDMNSLHNWAIATYYQAQINPKKLADCIIAWSTTLANIKLNSSLQNILWLGNKSVDLNEVSTKLTQILENLIDTVNNKNPDEYLQLRDVYRREMIALSLINSSHSCGMRIKKLLFITPGCYQRYRDKFSQIKFPAKVWGALYTDWGLAVAACYEGDTARAIKIKPGKDPSSEVGRFAYRFVSYHEGCYYLQNLEWRKAIYPLQQAKLEIKAKSDWRKAIDRLSELQRHKINNFDEHLEFSKFWYELIDSESSRSYFIEQKAIQIAQKLDDKKISFQQSLNELKELQQIDPDNSLTLNLIKKAKFNLEVEKIDSLMKQSQFEEAVKVAKRSRHEEIRFIVAEICLEIILEQIQGGNLSYEIRQSLNQIANWAYELCPHEPEFQPIYSQLRTIGFHC